MLIRLSCVVITEAVQPIILYRKRLPTSVLYLSPWVAPEVTCRQLLYMPRMLSLPGISLAAHKTSCTTSRRARESAPHGRPHLRKGGSWSTGTPASSPPVRTIWRCSTWSLPRGCLCRHLSSQSHSLSFTSQGTETPLVMLTERTEYKALKLSIKT